MLQAGKLVRLQRLFELVAPGSQALEVIRVQGFSGFVGVTGHAGVGQQEVPDFIGLAWQGPAAIAWRLFMPGGFGAFFEAAGAIDLMARTDQAVAGKQLVAKPGHAGGFDGQRVAVRVLRGFAINGVEPQRHLGQLHRHRVQIDPIDIAVGQVHAHFLQLLRVVVVRDALAQLSLFALQVGFGQLVDGFVQKRGAAHGRLTHGEGQDVIGALDAAACQQLFEGVLDQAAGQHLGGVVTGAFLPVTPGQAVDEATFAVLAQLAVAGIVLVIDALVFLVVGQVAGRHKPGVFKQIRAAAPVWSA